MECDGLECSEFFYECNSLSQVAMHGFYFIGDYGRRGVFLLVNMILEEVLWLDVERFWSEQEFSFVQTYDQVENKV